MFVDWRGLNAVFCGAMWILVVVLALVILVHQLPPPRPVHHYVIHAMFR